MKVLEINTVCGIKSTGRICTDIADSLKENGHLCTIAYGREQVHSKYKDISYRMTNNLTVIMDGIITRIFDNAGFNSRQKTKNFINWIKEFDPDIIHLHNIHGYYINIEILFNYIKEAKKPVVWTLHDCWSFTGHCAYFTYIDCEKWKHGCHHCPKKTAYPSSLLFDNSKKNYQRKKALFENIPNLTIVTPSEWLADVVKNSFLKNHSVKVINNGIDTNIFKPTESDFKERFGLQDKKIILGVASIWEERKGLNDFYKLSELLNENEKIVLVGLSKKQKKCLPDNIIGITSTSSAAELATIYTAADVFVNTTYEDNYPTVNLEAQACKTPVITYRTGGSVESVPPENVINPGDIIELKKKINSNLKIKSQEFSKGKMISEYLKLFHNLTSN